MASHPATYHTSPQLTRRSAHPTVEVYWPSNIVEKQAKFRFYTACENVIKQDNAGTAVPTWEVLDLKARQARITCTRSLKNTRADMTIRVSWQGNTAPHDFVPR